MNDTPIVLSRSQSSGGTTRSKRIKAEYDTTPRAMGMAMKRSRAHQVAAQALGLLLATGHGVRSLATGKPVTPTTRFMIGSTTKSLTTLLMAVLADRGLLTWDTPVTQILPSFALGDAATTAAVTLRHTVCACTGMPRQDQALARLARQASAGVGHGAQATGAEAPVVSP